MMRCRGNPVSKLVPFVICMIIPTLFLSCPIRAGEYFLARADTVIKGELEYQSKDYGEALAEYLHFSDEGMGDAYSYCLGIRFHYGSREFWTFKPADRGDVQTRRSASRGEIGLIFAQGEPLQTGSGWVVDNSSLGMLVLPVAITFLYRLSGEGEEYFEPYFGIGLGGFFGFERISAKVQNENMVYDWHDTCYRQSFAGHILLGANKKFSERIRMVFEVRWTQAGKGRLKRGTLSAQEIEEGWGKVFGDFQHPDFNFTGLSASMGFRW